MLQRAILFDAHSTLRQAVDRLERNRIWLDAEQEGARAWLGRLEEAGITRDDGLRRLRERVVGSWAAVRRQYFGTILWYRFHLPEFLQRLSAWLDRPDASLLAVLDLHEPDSVPTIQLGDDPSGQLEGFEGVVLDGNAIVGVGAEPPARANGPPRGAQPAAGLRAPPVRIAAAEPAPAPAPATYAPPAPPPAPAPPPPPRPAATRHSARRSSGIPRMEDILSASSPSPTTRVIRAHPYLDAPQQVEAGQAFDLEVGLAPEAVAGVAGGEMRIERPAEEARFDVHLHVVAEGFEAPKGWRHVLVVEHAAPYAARVRIPLKALTPPGHEDPARAVALSTITVEFVVGDVRCGEGSRRIAVVPKGFGALPAAFPRGVPWLEAPAATAPLALAEPDVRADLEITLAKPDGNDVTGRFKLTFRTPHAVMLPQEPLNVDLGTDAHTFAGSIIEDVRLYHGTPLIEQTLKSLGNIIADQLPADFWRVVRDVAARVREKRSGVVPSVLLYSADPWVPWELAWMEDPLDPTRPSFLGAQTRMGRWITGENGRPSPPVTSLDVKTMAAVVGMYQVASGFSALPKAKAEVDELTRRYNALAVEAEISRLTELFGARLAKGAERVGAEAVHFAAHGQVDPARPESAALFLSDGKPLKARLFRKTDLGDKYSPFLFLNACMVGTGGEVLGDADGFPGNCLRGGFRALLAPLWAVDDAVAHDLALEFYQRAFGADGAAEPVGTILRDLRQRYDRDTSGAKVPTYLAYVFYGHPELTLRATWES